LGGPHAAAEEKCEEEGMAEMKYYELTIAPISCPLVLLKEVRR